ncbi:hypothetical protein E4U41_004935, partial [Claviceps citrina]
MTTTSSQHAPTTHGVRTDPRTGIVVFSGGSAANSLVDVFERVREANNTTLSYVIPISDNGGSTSEIIRVFGGPGIGDVRSRLVRLIPDNDNGNGNGDDNDRAPETASLRQLFNHRLAPGYDAARSEWHEMLDATHPLWAGVSSPKRELIRAHLNSFNLEVVKRTRPGSTFDFSRASVGNLFLTGARLLTGSFEAAVCLLGCVCAVPDRVAVLPAVNTNFAHHIAAGLQDGAVITGQNDISHPGCPTAAVPGVRPCTAVGVPTTTLLSSSSSSSSSAAADAASSSPSDHDATQAACTAEQLDDDDDDHQVEDANLPGSLPALRRRAIAFSKTQAEDLPSRIRRIWYINPYGQEMRVPANPRVLDALRTASTVIYSIGSLFTSLVPSLILGGVGDAIASPAIRHKVLLLNGTTDRETGPPDQPLSALDF